MKTIEMKVCAKCNEVFKGSRKWKFRGEVLSDPLLCCPKCGSTAIMRLDILLRENNWFVGAKQEAA